MSTFYLNQASSVYIFDRQDEVSISYPAYFSSTLHDQKVDDHHLQAQLIQQMPNGYWLMNRSPHDTGDSSNSLKLSLGDHYRRHDDQTTSKPNKWMPSKMRFMKKMMNSNDDYNTGLSKQRRKNVLESQDHRQRKLQDFSAGKTSDFVRVCSDCNTTKTPLWRSGPRGPKSLCNACGIRQRKARRAMAAAAEAVNGANIPKTEAPEKVRKERNLVADCNLPIKKRCKIATATYTPPLEDTDTSISLSVNSTFHKVFPQDERDAAILLMTLSYGFVPS